MIRKHRFSYQGNIVSTRGIEACLYLCDNCGVRRRTVDLLPNQEISRIYKAPNCGYRIVG